MNPFVHQSQQRRPPARPTANKLSSSITKLRGKCAKRSSGRAGGEDISALFRASGGESISIPIHHKLGFLNIFWRDRVERGSRERVINYSSIVIQPIVSNPTQSIDPADRGRRIHKFHFDIARSELATSMGLFYIFNFLGAPLSGSRRQPGDTFSLKIPIVPRRRRQQRRRR